MGTGHGTREKLYRDRVRLRVRELCGTGFVPIAPLAGVEHVVVYRIGRSSGDNLLCHKEFWDMWVETKRTCPDALPGILEDLSVHATLYGGEQGFCGEVPCFEDEANRWRDAESAYLGTLSRALETLHHAHGGQASRLDLSSDPAVRPLSPLLASPVRRTMWRPWRGAASRKAQRAFLACAEQAAEIYRPVREEIERRVVEHTAEDRAAAQAIEKETEHWEEVFLQIAGECSWACAESADAVFVHRCGVPPQDALPDSARSASAQLTTEELENLLAGSADVVGGRVIRWDARARAETEKECRERGMPVTFHTWWRWVTGRHWRETSYGPNVPDRPGSYDAGARGGGYGSSTSGSGGYTGAFPGGGF